MARCVVVCDDEELIRWSICEHLASEGFSTLSVENGQLCVEAVQTHQPDLVIMDLKMPVLDGLGALQAIREGGSDVPVIMITAHGAVDSAIEATRLGASEYLSKPFDLADISRAVEKALRASAVCSEGAHTGPRRYGDFIGRAPVLAPVFALLRQLESVDAPTVLLTGESGTGKDVIARAIHSSGVRKNGVFVEIDCASLPEHLIESELFGHERGAFTDARQMKKGLFEVGAGGVVFLDEIGEMSLATQAKFLRALENRRFKRVGGVQPIEMKAGIIAATNRDLQREVAEGRFREDLYFRLHVIPIHLPPLRSRREDIPDLVGFFLRRFARSFGRSVEQVSRSAMEHLVDYHWPGNVRELKNVLERIVILSSSETINVDDLPAEIQFSKYSGDLSEQACPFTLPEQGVQLEAVERGLIMQALQRTSGNQSASARLLGITRYALRYRMEKYELER